MPDKVLFAIDPGPHTGMAVKIEGSYHTATITAVTELWDMLNQFRPEIVAYENFATSSRVDVNMIETMNIVGSIMGICHVLGLKINRQQPQERKAFILDARKILIAESGKTVHEIDALAHLLRLEYLIKQGKLS